MVAPKEGDSAISAAHHEVSGTGQPSQPEVHSLIAAFEERKIDLRTILGIAALAVTYESAILSFVLPSSVLLTINADIGPSAHYNWAATAWTLAQAVIMTIAGSLSDIFGRRNFALAGNLLGLIGCIIGCRAKEVTTVIVALTITGVGSGPQILALACANEIVPKKSRGKAMASLNIASMPGSCFGSLIAYRLVAALNWRWTFYVGIISNGLALVLIAIFYWPPGFIGLHPEGKTKRQQFKELDFVGLLLFGGGLTIFLIGISWGNNPYSWRSVQVLVPLLLGGLTFLVAFPLWETYSSKKIAKLCPPEIFANFRPFVLPLVVAFVSGMLLTSFQVLWPQEVQLLFTTVPQTVGWYSVAYNTPATLGGAFAAISFSTFGHTRLHFFTVTLLHAVFTASVASVTQHTPARAIVLVVFAAFFIGATQFIKILMLQFAAPDKHIGLATGLMGSATATGGAIAIAVYSAIIQNKASSDLAPAIAAAASQAGLPTSQLESFIVAFLSGSSSALAAVQGVTPAVLAAATVASKGVYAQAFKLVFLVTLAFGVLACLAAAFTPSVDHKLTSQINVTLDAPHLMGHGKGEALVLYDLGENKVES